MAAMLEIKDFHYYYGQIHVLKGISMSVEQGETVALIGSNGAGKTTTLRAISGLVPAKGMQNEILFNGKPIQGMAANKIAALGIAHADHGCCVAFGTLVQLVLEGATQEEFDEVQNFCLEVGLPVTLAEIGVTTKEQIASIAEHACVPGETIHNLAGDVQPIELYDAILQADAMGKRALGQTSC